MKKSLKIVVIAVIALLATTAIYAQEWTKEQSEVWKVVEDSWTKWKTGDTEAMATFIHEKYQGWSDDMPLPMGKAAVINWYKEMKDKMKVENVFLEPARIVILKNAAVVDYYFDFNITYTVNDKSESNEVKGKNVEFYVKEGDKWLLLGDMSVHQDKEDD